MTGVAKYVLIFFIATYGEPDVRISMSSYEDCKQAEIQELQRLARGILTNVDNVVCYDMSTGYPAKPPAQGQN